MAQKKSVPAERKTFTCTVETPLGPMTAAAEEEYLTGLWFIGQSYHPLDISRWHHCPNTEVFRWLRIYLKCYFSGKVGNHDFPLAPRGSLLEQEVWDVVRGIPYGRTVRPATVLWDVTRLRHCESVTAEDVEVAIRRNPIAILIPSHRVFRATGTLSDYPGGRERKEKLLAIEGVLSRENPYLKNPGKWRLQELQPLQH